MASPHQYAMSRSTTQVGFPLTRLAAIDDYAIDATHQPFIKPTQKKGPFPAPALPPPALSTIIDVSSEEKGWIDQQQQQQQNAVETATSASAPEESSSSSSSTSSTTTTSPTSSYQPSPFAHQSPILTQFFSSGSSPFVSENGNACAQLYWKTGRPLGGRMRGAIPNKTTEAGYGFDTYTKGT